MEPNEIRRKFYSPDTKFYGRMYGTTSPDDRIIEIDKSSIQFSAEDDGFCYTWGWPGPDWNFYKFTDYGRSWTFDMKDFKEKENGTNT